jgi:protein required for attachment to host cells
MTELTPIPEGALIVVADGGSARVFTNVGTKSELKLKQQDELVLRDVSEAGVSGQGPSGSVPKDMTIAQMNEATFAKQLAEQLNDDALNNRYSHLVLVADPQTLGRIRPQLHKEVQSRLVRDLAKDFTNAPLEDIQRALG